MYIPQLLIIVMLLSGCPDDVLLQQDFSDAGLVAGDPPKDKAQRLSVVHVLDSSISEPDAEADAEVIEPEPDAEVVVDAEVLEPEPDAEADAEVVVEPDHCPDDAAKLEPGDCGCGQRETGDEDGDGWADCVDLCPTDPDKQHPGLCGCWVRGEMDRDGDGYIGCMEQCDNNPLKQLAGKCGCSKPETGDSDGDGWHDCVDVCPGDPSKYRAPC